MPNRPDPDIPTTPDAHVPWESIDEVEESTEADEGSEQEDQAEEAEVPVAFASVEADDRETPALPPSTGGGWTVPLLCAGVALIACCALIPQADANRRLAYERQELQRDLETVEKQIAVNTEFLKQVGQDPTLAERLAQRQMKVVPEGTRILSSP